MTATNGPGSDAIAPEISNSELPHIGRIRTDTAGAAGNYGVDVTHGHVIVRNSQLYISGEGWSFCNSGGQPSLVTSTVPRGHRRHVQQARSRRGRKQQLLPLLVGTRRPIENWATPPETLDGRVFVSQLQRQLSP